MQIKNEDGKPTGIELGGKWFKLRRIMSSEEIDSIRPQLEWIENDIIDFSAELDQAAEQEQISKKKILKVTNEDIETFRKLNAKGMSGKQISDETGFAKTTINDYLKAIPETEKKTKPKVTPEDIKLFVKLSSEGLSGREISKETGFGKTTINSWLKEI